MVGEDVLGLGDRLTQQPPRPQRQPVSLAVAGGHRRPDLGHDELVDLVMTSGEGLTQMTEFFDRLQRTHSTRMHELGLA